MHVWEALNARRAPWGSNPFVWVVSFKRVESVAIRHAAAGATR